MVLGRIGIEVKDDFTVADETNTVVSGIDNTAFVSYLYDDNDIEVSSSIPITIVELGNGDYRAKFTPSSVGTYMLKVTHPTYFPWGKAENIQVFSNDFDTITTILTRALGLMQENYFMDNIVYATDGNMTNSRIRIYSNDSDVGTNNNIIATYNILASYTTGKLDDYSVKKV